MKRSALIGLLFLASLVVCGAYIPFSIQSPGITGMNSSVDVDAMKPTDARYLQNVIIGEHLGRIEKRKGHHNQGDNSVGVYNIVGYYNEIDNITQLIGIVQPSGNLVVSMGVDTVADPDTKLLDTFLTTEINMISVSDKGGSGLQDSNITIGVLYPTYNSDIELVDNRIIIANNSDIPYVYTPYRDTMAGNLHNPDSVYYNPNVVSLGLEAPGQLRVGQINRTDSKFGDYRYAYAFVLTTDTIADPSLESRIISVDSNAVYLTLFDCRQDLSYSDTLETGGDLTENTHTKAAILRQKVGYPWYIIDTIYYHREQYVYYVDTMVDGTGKLYDGSWIQRWRGAGTKGEIVRTYDMLGNPVPGGLYHVPAIYDSLRDLTDSIDVPEWNSEANFTKVQTIFSNNHFLSFSFYDDINNAESPLGPYKYSSTIHPVDDVAGVSTDSLVRGFTHSYFKPFERPEWIRVYRSESLDSLWLIQESDVVMYCVAQVRVGFGNPEDTTADDTSPPYAYTVFPGQGADSQLTTGLIKFVTDTTFMYNRDDIVTSITGDALTRPPFTFALEIPYNDIEYANGRLWGVGDPLYSERLYYSSYDDIFNWSPIDYLALNESGGDRLVALAKLPYGDQEILYAFKHREIYAIQGYDAEYDLSYALVASDKGVISKRSIVQLNNEIIFMSPNMKVYSATTNNPLIEISQPIEDYIDTIFTDYGTATNNLFAYRVNDDVHFMDTSKTRHLLYNTINKIWSISDYKSNINPVGSFIYDSTDGQIYGYGEDWWWYYTINQSDDRFLVEGADYRDSNTVAGNGQDVVFKYQTPFIGDGEYLYSIERVKFTGTWTGNISLKIINHLDDTLVTSTIAYDATNLGIYEVGFAENIGSYLSIYFYEGNNSDAWIGNVKIEAKKVGRNVLD